MVTPARLAVDKASSQRGQLLLPAALENKPDDALSERIPRRVVRWVNMFGKRQPWEIAVLEGIRKARGKYVHNQENQDWEPFHILRWDPQKGRLELVNSTTRIVFGVSDPPKP